MNSLPNKILPGLEDERDGDVLRSARGVAPLVLVELDFSLRELCLELVEACMNGRQMMH